MPRGGFRAKGSTKVTVPSRPSFVMGSRPPDLYAPRIAPRPQGNILKPPRITPLSGQRKYAKDQGFSTE